MILNFRCKNQNEHEYVECNCETLYTYSKYIQNLLNSCEYDTHHIFELPNIHTDTLELIIKLCSHSLPHEIKSIRQQPLKQQIDMNIYTMIDSMTDSERTQLIEASEFMVIEPIITLCCAYYAEHFKMITIANIKSQIQIPDYIHQHFPWLSS